MGGAVGVVGVPVADVLGADDGSAGGQGGEGVREHLSAPFRVRPGVCGETAAPAIDGIIIVAVPADCKGGKRIKKPPEGDRP